MKYTKGPLKVIEETFSIRSSSDVHLANVCKTCPPLEQAEANLKLFAAAPDLLESLIECLAIVRLKCGNLHEDTNAIQAKAYAAIDKAIQ